MQWLLRVGAALGLALYLALLPTLADPERCGSEEHCIEPCPQNAISMEWLPWEGDEARGKWKVSNLLAQTW
jgi:hypothetical protein